MADHSAWKTRVSLLEKIKDRCDDLSWQAFAAYYQPFIYNLARGMNIRHHDAEEIVQQVLVKAWNKLPEFEYDRGKGRFRGWLCQVTGNTVRDFIRKRREHLHTSTEEITNEEDSYYDCVNVPEIEDLAEREWKVYISNLAWEAVSQKFQANVAQAFLMSVEGQNVQKIAQELGIAEASVYVYKSRVQKALREEIIQLNRKLG